MDINSSQKQKKFEDFAYILDFLPRGKIGFAAYKAEPMVQLVGETYFTLLEAKIIKNITPTSREKIYIGKESYREKINHIIGRIDYNDLTSVAKTELPPTLEKIVKDHEEKYVAFFNNTTAITPRMHSLELLPGIGKKYMWNILRARERKPFTSFQDMQDRAKLHDPAKLIVKRILEELSEDTKYRLFTRSP